MNFLLTSPWPLVGAAVLYIMMAWAFWRVGQRGLAITHLCYAFANVGLILTWYEVRP